MGQQSSKIGWIVPALAISLVAGGGFGWYFAASSSAPVSDAQNVQNRAVAATTPAPTEGQRVIAALEALPASPATQQQEVSRTAPVDLLATAPVVQPAPVVAPAVQPNRAPETADTSVSASFFANAQANLAEESACGDDLRALAAGTKVYFPTGGLSPGDAGLAAARLIGQVARDCPGFSVQVEGHSDASGNANANQILSQRRADVVLSRLAAGGIDTSRFISVGYGDKRPSGTTGPLEDAYYDRRVEFSIVENVQQASLTAAPATQSWQRAAVSDCVQALQSKADQTRIFYSARAITVSPSEMEAVKALAEETSRCDGARLRLVGHHSDEPSARETSGTGRLRVLAMMSTLVSAGFDSQKILLGAPSKSMDVAGQPGLPNSRVDFQIIQD